MEPISGLQALLGTGGGIIITGLVEMVKRTVLGWLVPEEWWGRAVPGLCLLLGAGWNVAVIETLRALEQPVTWSPAMLVVLTVFAALSAMGLYSATKSVTGN